MKKLNLFFVSSAALLGATLGANAHAQAAPDPGKMEGMKMDQAAAPTEMTDAEVRKVDLEGKKLTLKHGEIKNLEMPGMTMLFQVKDPAMLTAVKAGDKVKFRAERVGGAFVVTDIQLAK